MSHLDTKTWLLQEALTKKNSEISEMEENNKGLIQLLENYEDSKQKYKEEIEILRFKCEKYEIKLDRRDKIDIDSLDGRVTFLVNLLEEYWKWLEEDVRLDKEREDWGDFDQQSSLIDFDDQEVCKKLTK